MTNRQVQPMEFIDPLADLTGGRAKFRGLLVGVNEYGDDRLQPLNYAIADCRDLATALTVATEKFAKRDIRHYFGLANQTPLTVEDVNAALDALLADASPPDTFLLYFAGHGVLEAETNRLFLCLPSTDLNDLPRTGLEVQTVLQRLNDSRVSKQVVMLDACHSGSVKLSGDRGVALLSRSDVTDPAPEPDPNFTPKLENALQQYATQSRKSFHALLSCAPEQKSWESPELAHGAFTYYLIQGIKGSAANERGRVDVDSLYKYVRDHTQQYVFKHFGRSQTPNHIKVASQDIVIGLAQLEQSSDSQSSGNDALLFREDQYRRNVWQALEQGYPLSLDTQQQLRIFAEESLFLATEDAEQIETKAIQEFEQILENYRKRAVKLLHEQFPHSPNLFAKLRETIGFRPEILAPCERAAQEIFEQHQQRYTAEFSRKIRQQLSLNREAEESLKALQKELGLCDQAIEMFETTARKARDLDEQKYRQRFTEAIHQEINPDRASLNQFSQEISFGDTVIQAIEAEEIDRCNQHKQQYCDAFSQSIHQSNAPNMEPLRRLQQELNLGNAVVEQLQGEATERCHQHKQQYRDAFSAAIRQQSHLNAQTQQELDQKRQALGLSTEVVEELEEQEIFACEQDKETFRDAFHTAIHREPCLTQETEILLQQLQYKLRLSEVIIETLKQEALETLEQNKQRYLREFIGAIRQRYPLNAGERFRLSQRQQQLGLSNEIVDELTTAAIAQLKQDKKDYWQAFDTAIRQQFPLDESTRHQLHLQQQQRELSDSLIESIEKEVTDAFDRHRQEYCDVFLSYLDQSYPLTAQERQALQKIQQDLRLGNAVITDIEQVALASFLKRRADQEQQIQQETEAQQQAIAAHNAHLAAREAYAEEFNRRIRQYNLLANADLSATDREVLLQLASSHNLSQQETAAIAQQVTETYRQNLQKYQAAVEKRAQQNYPLNDEDHEFLENFRISLKLTPAIAAEMTHEMTHQYEQKVQEYEQIFTQKLYEQHELNPQTRQDLKQLQQKLQLSDEIIKSVEVKVEQIYQEKVRQYEQKVREILSKRNAT